MIEREDRDNIAILRMQRGKGNALNTEFANALSAALDDAAKSDARSLVLTGDGKIFCAGVDLPGLIDGDRASQEAFLQALGGLFERLARFEKPLVAAVNGHAIAGGCIAVMAADYSIAVESAKLGLTELLVGVPFPTWPLEIARAAIPPQHLREVFYTGRLYQGTAAIARGFVDEIADADGLLDRACEVAAQIGNIPPETFRLTKRQLRAPLFERVEQQSPLDDPTAVAIWTSDTARNAIAEFVAKTIKRT